LDIFQIAKQDKSLIFSDFPVVQFRRKESVDWTDKHALISAIGYSQDTQGLTAGTDNFEISFNVNSFEQNEIPREDDLFKYSNEDGVEKTLRIDTIMRDKSDISLGIWLCYAVEVATEDKAGQIDRDVK